MVWVFQVVLARQMRAMKHVQAALHLLRNLVTGGFAQCRNVLIETTIGNWSNRAQTTEFPSSTYPV
jgi:3-deoxy-D-arabino-heptulosonate 7-phosphate (DAHP) synthase class II